MATSPPDGESLVSRLERSWMAAILASVLTLVALCAVYAFGLPHLAEATAAHISFEQEATLREQVLSTVDDSGLFEQSQLTEEQLKELETTFARVTVGQKSGAVATLVVRSSRQYGANALALPGSIILVTDSLVSISENPDQIASVLAHELGHLELRHALRQTLQEVGLFAIIGALTGDLTSVAVLGALPMRLGKLNYSRDMETEADEFALSWLMTHDVDAGQFARVLDLLSKQTMASDSASYSYLATHPDTDSRIQRALQVSRERTARRSISND